MVLGGGDRDGSFAVAEGEEGDLFAGEELLEDDLGLGGAEKDSGEHLGGGALGLEVGVADDDAFSGGQSGGFHHDRDGEARQLGADVVEGGAERVLCGWDVVALHEGLGEGLR